MSLIFKAQSGRGRVNVTGGLLSDGMALPVRVADVWVHRGAKDNAGRIAAPSPLPTNPHEWPKGLAAPYSRSRDPYDGSGDTGRAQRKT